ncbi:pyridoxamine 5'-phosphate oxidase-like FMN-binding protein [Arthrobacter crystallopoietes BAB-32]|uniref:Pyridoxamine 5'-phosphate oxidase-like FMN-binding protein n=1 Tax=Arthrobacter crystallopoietes BAB-32 TaxID=1246476 RepID=N1V0C5_9MICC|nr:pyridoxamine 5'-phosphate oxidase family protein [Arthrobacter crystallopoietes]EMY34745.1 pyridoxamine 5'-phosphate oxidase-like FMN-binding protein [Arthrobacter crystallopoietes BAB-32]
MTAMQMPEGIENLSSSECWELFRSTDVGRLAVVVDGHPDLFPINYVVDHGSIVFRTARGTKLDAALSDAKVAFETDGYRPASNIAWSVVVKGPAERLSSIEDVLGSTLLPLFPWQAGEKNNFVRIVPDEVTGRRFRVQTGSRRSQGLSDARRLNVE